MFADPVAFFSILLTVGMSTIEDLKRPDVSSSLRNRPGVRRLLAYLGIIVVAATASIYVYSIVNPCPECPPGFPPSVIIVTPSDRIEYRANAGQYQDIEVRGGKPVTVTYPTTVTVTVKNVRDGSIVPGDATGTATRIPADGFYRISFAADAPGAREIMLIAGM